ncbi:hypothetical protein QJS04_geneDACA022380 [Acorus gramineus]|uniref:Uncharacterized protein n=1 Tax=Acorus gramineus TaxID=55184 RepID=A0AAV9B0T4_ACOGR|nr:hypothetical protein QJS04_geneDACA022380 [Acorus gramineus]
MPNGLGGLAVVRWGYGDGMFLCISRGALAVRETHGVAGDGSVGAKITQPFIPTMIWSIWWTRNLEVFKGNTPYVENICKGVARFIVEWGRYCAGASDCKY